MATRCNVCEEVKKAGLWSVAWEDTLQPVCEDCVGGLMACPNCEGVLGRDADDFETVTVFSLVTPPMDVQMCSDCERRNSIAGKHLES